jgi:ubiquinone/menaquinone biosynthesis C-methylase UbiE
VDPSPASSNFDRVAPIYRWLEYLTFGCHLEMCREWSLPQLAHSRRALVLGDGDGRFLSALLEVNPNLCADVVDASGAMLSLLRDRIPAAIAEGRVRTYHENALMFLPPESDYDLVITHFFLDCFLTSEVAAIVSSVSHHLAPNALWIVSEFTIPPQRFASLVARGVVSALYLGFRLLAGLRVRELPDHASVFRLAGLRMSNRKTWLGGLIASEVWRLETQPCAGEKTGRAAVHS